MSGTSGDRDCPICGKNMSIYTDWKPIDSASGECLNCGFCYYTKIEQMSLKEINERRDDWNSDYEPEPFEVLKPLTKKDLNKWKDKIKNFYSFLIIITFRLFFPFRQSKNYHSRRN